MKSPIAEQYDSTNLEYYSDLQVMQSAAGYYIGSDFTDHELGGMKVPGTRDTEYFDTKQEAEEMLQTILSAPDPSIYLRGHP